MLRTFFRTPSAIFALAILALLVATAVFGPGWASERAVALDFAATRQGPSWHHLFGTDQLGRDVLTRVVSATRLSLVLAVSAVGIGAVGGVSYGVIAALLPRRLRTVALRSIDALLAFPAILVAIIVGAILGPGIGGAVVGVGLALSFSFARVSSSLALSISGREYILAARVAGVSRRRLITRYVLPNIGESLVITATVAVSSSIVAVSTLSFLGMGVQIPSYDWGRMLTDGVQSIYLTPFAALAPALAIAVSSVAFGLGGEAMARAMNPVLWTQRRSPSRRRSFGRPQTKALRTPANSATPVGQRAHDRETVLELHDLVVQFPGREGLRRVVDGVSFTVARGEKVGIVGESGSGKSTTALAIAKLVSYPGVVNGRVLLNGWDLDGISKRQRDRMLGTEVAIVYQDALSSLNPALKIGTQLTEATEFHRGTSAREARSLAIKRLADVDIPAPETQLDRYPHELSGGMRQRVMIAMGLMTNPSLLIADEPTTALDVTVQSQVMDVLQRVISENKSALILVSHNLGLIAQNCDRVLVMYAGRIVEELTSAQVDGQASHPYSRALLAAVPDIQRPRDTPLAFIPGQPPDGDVDVIGCAYAARCPLVMDRCRVEAPRLELRPAGNRVACWLPIDGSPAC